MGHKSNSTKRYNVALAKSGAVLAMPVILFVSTFIVATALAVGARWIPGIDGMATDLGYPSGSIPTHPSGVLGAWMPLGDTEGNYLRGGTRQTYN